jgi:hypothetical protein
MQEAHLRYNRDYLGPLSARVDWVAGGNFDGYLYQQSLRFARRGSVAWLRTKIVDASRYDDVATDSVIEGEYACTDHGTITCTFGSTRMRGVLLGKGLKTIAFSQMHPQMKQIEPICFTLQSRLIALIS